MGLAMLAPTSACARGVVQTVRNKSCAASLKSIHCRRRTMHANPIYRRGEASTSASGEMSKKERLGGDISTLVRVAHACRCLRLRSVGSEAVTTLPLPHFYCTHQFYPPASTAPAFCTALHFFSTELNLTRSVNLSSKHAGPEWIAGTGEGRRQKARQVG